MPLVLQRVSSITALVGQGLSSITPLAGQILSICVRNREIERDEHWHSLVISPGLDLWMDVVIADWSHGGVEKPHPFLFYLVG